MQKVPIEVEEVSESVKIDSDHSRTQRIKRYKLPSYNVIGIDSIVTLAPKG